MITSKQKDWNKQADDIGKITFRIRISTKICFKSEKKTFENFYQNGD